MTETEQKVVEILTSHPRTHDHWKEPIHAVDKAMGWDSARTRVFVEDLMRRQLIAPKTEAINRGESPTAKSRWWWERGSAS